MPSYKPSYQASEEVAGDETGLLLESGENVETWTQEEATEQVKVISDAYREQVSAYKLQQLLHVHISCSSSCIHDFFTVPYNLMLSQIKKLKVKALWYLDLPKFC